MSCNGRVTSQRVIEYSDLPPEEPMAPIDETQGNGAKSPQGTGGTSPAARRADGLKASATAITSSTIESWPRRGTLVLRDVVMQYAPDLPHVLRGVSLDVEHGQRVGIVGRVRLIRTQTRPPLSSRQSSPHSAGRVIRTRTRPPPRLPSNCTPPLLTCARHYAADWRWKVLRAAGGAADGAAL